MSAAGPRVPTLAGLLLLAASASGVLPAPASGDVTDPLLQLDTGADAAAVRLTALGPGPYVVVPVFTRCRAVCSVEAKALAAAWSRLDTEASRSPVVLVSFDPEDTPRDMAHFRELFRLPSPWHLGVLEREEGLRFFRSLGFQWRTLAQRQFEHAGKVFVLTPTLRIAAVLGPEQLTPDRLRAEIDAARSGPSLARRIGTHWIGFFGVGSLVLLVVALVTWDKLRAGAHGRGTSRRPACRA